MKNTIEILERMNTWRRSDLPVFDGGEMPCPKEFGFAIDDAVRKLRAMEWQSILTAPRDGSAVLLYRPLAYKTNDPIIAIGLSVMNHNSCLQETVPDGYAGLNYTSRSCFATHWMPLPSPPAC